jgi:hypothetical protein
MSYAELNNIIDLGEGDALFLSSPSSIMGKQPPHITSTTLVTPSPIITQTLMYTPTPQT